MSIRPQYVAKILNGEKTIEIRKKFPSDYVGWVYIYCCKQKKNEIGCHINYRKVDGKVVARFWCDKVERISPRDYFSMSYHRTETLTHSQLLEKSCLTTNEIKDYLKRKGKAIHITNLEIFDKPKEISEFRYAVCPKTNCEYCKYNKTVEGDLYCTHEKLTRAPQSWCYVEV